MDLLSYVRMYVHMYVRMYVCMTMHAYVCVHGDLDPRGLRINKIFRSHFNDNYQQRILALCEIVDFRCCVVVRLLGYTAYFGSYLPTFRDILLVPSTR
jgi:hypothetical protein